MSRRIELDISDAVVSHAITATLDDPVDVLATYTNPDHDCPPTNATT